MKLVSGGGKKPEKPKKRQQSDGDTSRKKSKAPTIILTVLALIIIGTVVYFAIATKPPEIKDPDPNPPEASGTELQASDDPQISEDERYYTMLIVGEDQLEVNTDTIMVARFDAIDHKLNIVSIPRDTLVNIPISVKKINTIYNNPDGGIDALLDEIDKIAGFRPNNYVIVNIEAFERIIDAIGGVWFDVPQDMWYHDYTPEYNYEFTIELEAGYQLLNGYDALGVWRFRQNDDGTGYADGDIGRLEVQHDLLMAIAQQVMDLGLADWNKLLNIAQVAMDTCKTDLALGNVLWYAKEFLKMDLEDLDVSTVPGNYFTHIRNWGYVSIYVDEWLEIVNEKLSPLDTPVTREDVEILYQVAHDNDRYELDPANYPVTNGAPVAGGLDSFYWPPGVPKT
ncbi:MAG: LCP family protein [Oscillospiraceae bacterium]|jgi:LCP family protein required for cell wall assembly|nr:LCP family protein [Oscillospiraceae bacterium]